MLWYERVSAPIWLACQEEMGHDWEVGPDYGMPYVVGLKIWILPRKQWKDINVFAGRWLSCAQECLSVVGKVSGVGRLLAWVSPVLWNDWCYVQSY